MIRNSPLSCLFLCSTAFAFSLNASDFCRDHTERGLNNTFSRMTIERDQPVNITGSFLEEKYQQAIRGHQHAFTELIALSGRSELAASYVSILCFFGNQHIKKDVGYAQTLAARSLPWLLHSEDGYAQLNLGLMHAKGIGTPEDLTESTACFRRAAEAGIARAQYNMGIACDQGKGILKNTRESLCWYEKARDQGYIPAIQQLRTMYAHAINVERDLNEVTRLLHLEAEHGDISSQCALGSLYCTGNESTYGLSVPIDREKALYWYQRAAEQGDASAQYNLGLLHVKTNSDSTQHKARAFSWIQQAAEKQFIASYYTLACFYRDGIGTERNDVEAAKWFLLGAENGDALAQLNLGVVYDTGKGVTKDPVQSVKWIRKAAEQGNPTAQYHLSLLYKFGKNVARSSQEAFRWSHMAAKQGMIEAQFSMGTFYDSGDGVAQDHSEALNW
ncbi:MAG: hypothetical protein ACK4V2_02905 [Pseudomonadota bacterium]|jgi:TPR repeat protein